MRIFCKKIFTFRQRYFPRSALPCPGIGSNLCPSGEIQVAVRSTHEPPKKPPGIELQAMFTSPDPDLNALFSRLLGRRLEPRTSSGRASCGALKPWHTPNRQRPGRAKPSGKATRQCGQKDFYRDPSSGRPPRPHGGSLPWSRQGAVPPSAGRAQIHTPPPRHPARARNPPSPRPTSSNARLIGCRSRTPRQRAPRAWEDEVNPYASQYASPLHLAIPLRSSHCPIDGLRTRLLS